MSVQIVVNWFSIMRQFKADNIVDAFEEIEVRHHLQANESNDKVIQF